MDNPENTEGVNHRWTIHEKLATYSTQDEEKKTQNSVC
jgi:hypothetical protein